MTHPGCGKKTKKGKRRKHTPITSRRQQRAMGAAYAKKKGKKIRLYGASKKMAKSMSKAELRRDLLESGGKNLPQTATHSRRLTKRIYS